MIRSLACHRLFQHVVIGPIMWISVPSHRESSHKFWKLVISNGHTFYKFTILFLFLESMLLFLDATVDVMFYLHHFWDCDQGISHSSALNECVTEKIWAHPRTHVILCSFTCKLWYHPLTTGSSEGGGVRLLVVVLNQIVVVSTWSKNFAILEMSPMPAVNIFDSDGRTDEIGLGVPGDVGGGVKSGSWLSWWNKSGCHVNVKKFWDRKGVTAPTTSPLHILKGYKSDDAEMKNQYPYRFLIIFRGFYFQNSKSTLHGDDNDDYTDNIYRDEQKASVQWFDSRSDPRTEQRIHRFGVVFGWPARVSPPANGQDASVKRSWNPIFVECTSEVEHAPHEDCRFR